MIAVVLDFDVILLYIFSPGYIRTDILKRVVGEDVSEYVRIAHGPLTGRHVRVRQM